MTGRALADGRPVRNPVLIRKRSYDGSGGWDLEADLIEASGPWLVTLSDPARHELFVRGEADPYSALYLRYFNTALPYAWEFAFDLVGRYLQAKCDAMLPARLGGRTIEMVDLDLDVVVEPSGSYSVRDEEEFCQHTVEMAYPPAIVRLARKGVQLGCEAADRRLYPFDGSAELLLGRVLAAERPL